MLTVLATSKQRDQRIPAFIALILHMMTGPVMVSGLFLLTAPLTAGAVLILVSANLGTKGEQQHAGNLSIRCGVHERCSAIFRPAKAPKVASDQLQEQRKGWAQVWHYICEIEQ
jgi:hypothetical protein